MEAISMKTINLSFVWRALSDQRGQTLPLVAMGMLTFLGMAGLTIDVGHAYVVRSQLQSSSNAAVLAAAGSVYNTGSTSNASYVATQYSATKGSINYNPGMGSVNAVVSTPCLNSLLKGTTCAKTGNVANAVRITQTAAVQTLFMRMFGVKTLNVNASAMASMNGVAQLWNVAIVLDATGSMGTNDPYCGNITAEQCAMNGIQTMLKGINPCAAGNASCDATSASANFRVSLFAFPNVLTSQVAEDYNCGSGTPTAKVYTLPVIPPAGSTTGYTPFAYTGATPYTATYQITPPNVGAADANGFTSDYFSNGTLNSNSTLVKAIGNGSTKGCMKPPSTSGWPDWSYETYFAGAIYAAQTALQAEQAATSALGINTQNAIIFISDGQANMPYDGFPQLTSTAGTGGNSVTYYTQSTKRWEPNYSSTPNTTKNLTGTANTFGMYPDFHNDCQQAIMAAQYAKNQGTRVYAVAYGSEANGCVTDDGTLSGSKVVVTGTLNVPITSTSQVIPCRVMEDIASPGASESSPWYFYTDGSSTANGCTDTSHTSTNLNSIFGAIGATFTNPRLLPYNAT
jgi:hypothetical protein